MVYNTCYTQTTRRQITISNNKNLSLRKWGNIMFIKQSEHKGAWEYSNIIYL